MTATPELGGDSGAAGVVPLAAAVAGHLMLVHVDASSFRAYPLLHEQAKPPEQSSSAAQAAAAGKDQQAGGGGGAAPQEIS